MRARVVVSPVTRFSAQRAHAISAERDKQRPTGSACRRWPRKSETSVDVPKKRVPIIFVLIIIIFLSRTCRFSVGNPVGGDLRRGLPVARELVVGADDRNWLGNAERRGA